MAYDSKFQHVLVRVQGHTNDKQNRDPQKAHPHIECYHMVFKS
jgi:hypothetical protein